jgi:hypothetical protein
MSSKQSISNFIARVAMVFWSCIIEMILDVVILFQGWRCRRAKEYLLRHDRSYRNDYVGQEIVQRRNALYARGVSPLDPLIPDRWTIEEELPPMSWPHKSTLS